MVDNVWTCSDHDKHNETRLAARVSYLLETMIRYSRIKNIWSHNSFTLTLEQVNLTLMKVMKTGGDMMVKI